MYNVDSVFVKGQAHDICEDYATHANVKNKPVAVLADGCSTADRTDFGARLIAQSVLVTEQNSPGVIVNNFCERVIWMADNWARSMQLDHDALTATAVILRPFPDGIQGLQSIVAGDGAIAARCRHSKRWMLKVYEYEDNAPLYLRYLLNKDVLSRYEGVYSGALIAKTYNDIHSNIGFEEENVESPACRNFNSGVWDLVLGFSDGISSFAQDVETETGRHQNQIPVVDIVRRFVNFKGMAGSFLQRRVKGFLRRLADENIYPNDDFSAIAIYDDGELDESSDQG